MAGKLIYKKLSFAYSSPHTYVVYYIQRLFLRGSNLDKEIVIECRKMLLTLQADNKDLLENIPNLAETMKLGIPDKVICKALNSVQSKMKVTPYKLKKFRQKHGIVITQDQGAVIAQPVKKEVATTNAETKEKVANQKNAENFENSNFSKNFDRFADFKKNFTKTNNETDGIVDPSLFTTDEEP